jgi:hypothetical protein
MGKAQSHRRKVRHCFPDIGGTVRDAGSAEGVCPGAQHIAAGDARDGVGQGVIYHVAVTVGLKGRNIRKTDTGENAALRALSTESVGILTDPCPYP